MSKKHIIKMGIGSIKMHEELKAKLNLPSVPYLPSLTNFDGNLLNQIQDTEYVWMPPSLGFQNPSVFPGINRAGNIINLNLLQRFLEASSSSLEKNLTDFHESGMEKDAHEIMPERIVQPPEILKKKSYMPLLQNILNHANINLKGKVSEDVAKQIFVYLDIFRQQRILDQETSEKTKVSILCIVLVFFNIHFEAMDGLNYEPDLEEVCRSFLAFLVLLEKKILRDLMTPVTSHKSLIIVAAHLVKLKSLFLEPTAEPALSLFKKQFSELWEDLALLFGKQSQICASIGSFSRLSFSRLKIVFPDVVYDCVGKKLINILDIEPSLNRIENFVEDDADVVQRLFLQVKRKSGETEEREQIGTHRKKLRNNPEGKKMLLDVALFGYPGASATENSQLGGNLVRKIDKLDDMVSLFCIGVDKLYDSVHKMQKLS